MSAGLFREYAAEHLCWAKTASSGRERETFEQMARAWLEAAALGEPTEALPRLPPPTEGGVIADRACHTQSLRATRL
jgi:hypothetical protein